MVKCFIHNCELIQKVVCFSGLCPVKMMLISVRKIRIIQKASNSSKSYVRSQQAIITIIFYLKLN